MPVQIINQGPQRARIALARSELVAEGIRDTSFLIAHAIEQANQQIQQQKDKKLSIIATLASTYGFSKLGPDVTMEFERLSGVKFPRDDQGKVVIPQTDEENFRARMRPLAQEALNDPRRAQEIALGALGLTDKPKSQSELDIMKMKMDMQLRHNQIMEGIAAMNARANLLRAERPSGGSLGKIATPSGFMLDPKDKSRVIPWDGQSDQLNQQEFDNMVKNRNMQRMEDSANKKHLLDQLKIDSAETQQFIKMAGIVGNKNIPSDNPAKIAAQKFLDITAQVKFGVTPPQQKQGWGAWIKDILGVKPVNPVVEQTRQLTRPAKASSGRTQAEWDATVKQHLDAGINPADILDQSGGDPMVLQALINNGAVNAPQ